MAAASEACPLRIPRGNLPHPRDAGARPTVTWPAGQVADYLLSMAPGEAPLIIREFADFWEVFLVHASRPDQSANSSGNDADAALLFGGAILGGIIGASLSNKKGSVLLGAGIGLLMAAWVNAAEEQQERVKRRESKEAT